MLASGKPVIATAIEWTELANVVSQAGIVVPPNDIDGVSQAILKLANSPELRKHLGDKSLELVSRKWCQDKVLSAFLINLGVLIS